MCRFDYEIVLDILTQEREKARNRDLSFEAHPALQIEIYREELEAGVRLRYICRGGTQDMAFPGALNLLYHMANSGSRWKAKEISIASSILLDAPCARISLTDSLIQEWQAMGTGLTFTLRLASGSETGQEKSH